MSKQVHYRGQRWESCNVEEVQQKYVDGEIGDDELGIALEIAMKTPDKPTKESRMAGVLDYSGESLSKNIITRMLLEGFGLLLKAAIGVTVVLLAFELLKLLSLLF